MNWDDLRYFLALFRHGSLTAAARELGVNHATVRRRITALEEQAGAQAFQKTSEGFVLTAFGESLVAPAEAAEASFFRVERAVRNRDGSLRGEVRVTSSQLLSHFVVVPAVEQLRSAHPDIVVDVLEESRVLNLARQEADIALRLQLKLNIDGSDTLRVRQVGSIAWSIYATPTFVETHRLSDPLDPSAVFPVVVYDQHAPHPQLGVEWIAENAPGAYVAMRSNSMYTLRAAVEQNIGAGLLARCWAEAAGLVPLGPPVCHARIVIALHPDLDRNARVRTVFETLVAYATGNPQPFDD